MDIAAMSISMHSAQLQQNVSLALLQRTMNTQQQTAQTLISDMQAAVPPSSNIFSVRV